MLQTVLGIAFGAATIHLAMSAGFGHGIRFAMAWVALGAALLPVWAMVARRVRLWAFVQATAYIFLFLAFGHAYFTPLEAKRSAREVAKEVSDISEQRGWPVLMTRLPEEMAVYLDPQTRFAARGEHLLLIVDDQAGVRERARSHLPIPAPTLEELKKAFEGAVPDAEISQIEPTPRSRARQAMHGGRYTN